MKLFDYIKDTKAEMKHVSWPTKKQAVGYTVLVIVISVVVSVYLGILDFGLTELVTKLIS